MALLVIPIAQQQETRGGKYLTAMLLGAAIWSAGAAMEYFTGSITNQLFWSKIEYLGVTSVPVFFFLYSLEFNQFLRWLTRRNMVLLGIIPLITLLLAFTNEYHHLIWANMVPTGNNNITIYEYGRWFWFGVAGYSYCLLFAGSILFILTTRRMGKAMRNQVNLILMGTAMPWILNVFSILKIGPVPGLELTPLSIVFSGMIFNLAMMEGLRLQVMENSRSMEFLITDLREQIRKGDVLERDLRKSQELLAIKLTEQSSQLSGFYDLLLVTDQEASLDDVLNLSLAKIQSIIRAKLLLYFQPDEKGLLQMVAFSGRGLDLDDASQPFNAEWLVVSRDVRAFPFALQAVDLPRQLVQGHNLAALFKWAMVKNRPMGILAAYWDVGHEFSVEEIAMFDAITDGLGLIIENMRLQQSVANTATLQERRRLARDLHDSVTQSLNILSISAETALFKKDDPQHLERILNRLEMSAKQALKEMRLLLFELRLAHPSESNLMELLTTRLDAVERHSGINVELNIATGSIWPKEWEPQLYMLVMEALNNSLKHARATQVNILISGVRKNLMVEINDNGRGFDPAHVRPGGMGLKNMAERCANLGAELQIISSPANGTVVRMLMDKSG